MFKSRRIFFLLRAFLLPCLLVQADLPNKLNDLKKGLHALQDKLGHLKGELAALKDVLVVDSGGSKADEKKIEAIKKALQEIANFTSTGMALRTQIGQKLQGLESSKPDYSDYEAALKSFDEDTRAKIGGRVRQLKKSYDWLKKPKKEEHISVDLLVKTIDDTFAFFLKQSTDDMDEFRSHALNIFDKILTPESIFIMFDSIRLRDGIAFPIAMSIEATKISVFNHIKQSIIDFEANPARYPSLTTKDELRNTIKNFELLNLKVLIDTLCKTGYATAEEYFKSLNQEELKKFIEDITSFGSNLRKALFQAHAVRAALRNFVNPKENTLEATLLLIKSNPNALINATIFDKHAEQIFEVLLIPEALFVDLDLIDFRNNLFNTPIKETDWKTLLKKLHDSIAQLELNEHQKLVHEKMKKDKGNRAFILQETTAIKSFAHSDLKEKDLKDFFLHLISNEPNRNQFFNRHAARYQLRQRNNFYQIRLDEGVDLASDIPPVLNEACWKKYIESLDINNFNILYDNFRERRAWRHVFAVSKLNIQSLLAAHAKTLKSRIGSFDTYSLSNPADVKILRHYPDVIEHKITQVDDATFEKFCKENENFNSFSAIKKEIHLRAEAEKLFRFLELSDDPAPVLILLINKEEHRKLLSALSNHEYLRSQIEILNDKLPAIKSSKRLDKYLTPQSLPVGELKFEGETIEQRFQKAIKNLIDPKTKPFNSSKILLSNTKFIQATEPKVLADLMNKIGADHETLDSKIKNIKTGTANKLREAILLMK